MTTDEALRMINSGDCSIDKMDEENKKIKTELKKRNIPFAETAASIPDSYLITDPMMQLYAKGKRDQAVISERAYLEWLMLQKQVDLNTDETDEDKEAKEMAALVEKYM